MRCTSGGDVVGMLAASMTKKRGFPGRWCTQAQIGLIGTFVEGTVSGGYANGESRLNIGLYGAPCE